MKTIHCYRSIWFPSRNDLQSIFCFIIKIFLENWIVERTYPLPIERIPTRFAKYTSPSNEEEENRDGSLNFDVEFSHDFSICFFYFYL